MSLTRNKMMVTGGGEAVVGCPITYPIDNSVLISGESSAANAGYLSRSLSQSGDRKTWTYSTWIKRDKQANYQYIMSAGTTSQNYETLLFYPESLYSDRPNASFHYQYYTSNSMQGYFHSEMVLRDLSAWYHIVFVKDSTLATAADRLKLYVNGVRQDSINYSSTAFQTVSQNNEGYINSSSYDHYVGSTVYSTTSSDGTGYVAETNFVDGQGLTADDFGEIDTCSGQWVAKQYTGTYGTNGFYLPFSGKDLSNTFTDSTKYTVESFTNTGSTTWTVPAGVTAVDYLVVGGGGGASGGTANVNLGSGGAGGVVRTGYSHSVTPGASLTVTVGAGGAGSTTTGSNGDSSVFDTITATGGDGATQSRTGGSNADYSGGTNNSGTDSGGGAGAGGDGSGSNGGPGVPSSITGSSVTRGGGGAGGSPTGTASGGGAAPYGNGTANTGGGGGGGDSNTSNGAGGSGIVVVRYLNAAGATSGNTLTANGVSHSKSQKKIGRSSIEFTYSGNSYLSTGFSSDFAFGTGDYTFEAWVYPTTQGAPTYAGIMGNYISSGADFGTFFEIVGGKWSVYVPSTHYDTGVTASLNTWSHVALVREGTGSNQLKLYVNGSSVWTGTDSQNTTNTYKALISGIDLTSPYAFNGYMDEIRISNSARYTGTFTPSTTEFTADSNTKLLIHSDYDGGFASDNSGNHNDFTPTNLTDADVRPDTPTNNFCTLNPLGISDYTLWTFSKGNLKGVGAGDESGEATFLLSSGKWYFEVDHTDAGGKNGLYVSLVDPNDNYISGSFDVRLIDGSGTGLYGVSIDMDAGSFATTLNGSASSSGSFTPQDCKLAFVNGTTAFSKTFIANFGQDSSFAGARTAQNNADDNNIGDFYYAPPSGYLTLCTKNLPAPEIANPTHHFNTVLYTGNATTNAVTGVGFQADFVWIKDRDHVQNHALFDVGRGVNKQLRSNLPNPELSYSDLLTSFDTDGFTLGADANVGDINNYSGGKYVAWNWKAGGTAVSNTEGTIASSVSANPDAGFSIATYTGNGQTLQTVGHGLSQAPEMYIVKRIDGNDVWVMWNHNYPTNNYQILDGTNGLNDGTGVTWSTQPTSTVFGVDNDNSVNHSSSATYLAYCWHSVAGYSKVGIYDGVNSQDGTFVPTGFKPAFIFIKRITSGGSNSYIVDNKRIGYNQFIYNTDVGTNKYLWPDAATGESAGNSTKAIGMDILSNGFKFRTNSNDYNSGANSYIYLAIAESPFKYSNAR